MTEERLDELCGGAPTNQRRCSRCGRTTRLYCSAAMAADAMAEHVRWQHSDGGRIVADEGRGAR